MSGHLLSRQSSRPQSTEPVSVLICSFCGLVRTEEESSRERWVSKRTYMNAHGANFIDYRFTYTNCPKCFCTQPRSRSAFGDSMIVTQLLTEGGCLNWLRRMKVNMA